MSHPIQAKKPDGAPLRAPFAFWEREFLRAATSMLRCRFQLIHGRPCTLEFWIQYAGKPIDAILCYVGYSDHKGEMRLMCRERLEG